MCSYINLVLFISFTQLFKDIDFLNLFSFLHACFHYHVVTAANIKKAFGVFQGHRSEVISEKDLWDANIVPYVLDQTLSE